ncbi:MAG TPA: hypothetical protein VGQ95_13220 [Chthoniobacterales bacterium]|nr:hypothetical protein [Chthoniobacterales bacterium]
MLVLAAKCGAQSPQFFKGVTVSCQTWGIEWQTPEMAQALDELKSLGVNSVAIHPYARIENDGHVTFRNIDNGAGGSRATSTGKPARVDEPGGESINYRHITVPLDWARERGMSVMLIPHIGYWGSKFSWRGEIIFNTMVEWDRFFDDYERWIVEMAEIAEAHHAAILCVGLEFTYAQRFADRWRRIIGAVRKVYHGKVTYGANWNEYADVRFWDALDYIGVLAYFPLTKTVDPSAEEITAAWEKRCAELEKFSRANGGKKFLFTEIGYNESARAAAEPWGFKTGGDHAAEIQLRCIDAALGLTGKHPFLAGMFWWKWFPELPTDEKENYCLQTPAIKALIAKHWRD